MAVTAVINTLPVTLKEGDCKKLSPTHEPDYTVEFARDSGEDNVFEFPFCCAIKVLGDASVFNEAIGDYEKPNKYNKEALAKELETRVNGFKYSGLVLYTLIDNQVTEKEVLLEQGFVVMAVFKNPSTENRITLYGKLINQPKHRATAKKKRR